MREIHRSSTQTTQDHHYLNFSFQDWKLNNKNNIAIFLYPFSQLKESSNLKKLEVSLRMSITLGMG